MTHVALLGAGGNMGQRISRSLLGAPEYTLHPVEPDDAGRARVESLGAEVSTLEDALAAADIVVFAVPDKIVRSVAADVVPRLRSGTSILLLDPAAVAAERILYREDIHCYVTHPTHPPLYSLLAEEDPVARRDFWGGGQATQAIVFATAWGDERHADEAEQLTMRMFAPVETSHRITVDQMALLEPALTETLTNGCVAVIREGLDRVVAEYGVPEPAARDFLMGHLQIGIALIFDELDWKLSDGAQLALDRSREQLFVPDWYRVFEPDAVMASLKEITGGD